MSLSGTYLQMYEEASSLQGEFRIGDGYAKGKYSAGASAAALLGANGKIYTGVCADMACALGFCAELGAVAEMLKDQQVVIKAMVAVNHGSKIIPPCGRCREMISMLDARNLDCEVIISEDEILTMRELLPAHWLPLA